MRILHSENKVTYPIDGVIVGGTKQRKFPTAECPTKLDALKHCLEFLYARWKANNTLQFAMSPGCQSYIFLFDYVVVFSE